MGDCVSLVGPSDRTNCLRGTESADVFCLPSFTEGVPVVLMEAMAMELPVVATNIMGVPELVATVRAACSFRQEARIIWLRALEDLLVASPDRRAEMGAAGRARVAEGFRAERSAALLFERFREVKAPR